jgi:hypothetical protein
MKIALSAFPRIMLLLLPLWLAGCATMPGMSSMGPKFKPLDSEVAAMAAPGPTGTGKSLFCRVGRGSAHFGKAWLEFADAGFRLTPQSRVNVALRAKKGGGEMSFQALFDLEGQRIVFCPIVDGPPDERVSCASIYALEDDLMAGIKRTFDIPDAVAGSSITCAYDQERFQKL